MKGYAFLLCAVAAVVGCTEPSTQPIGDARFGKAPPGPSSASAGVTLPTAGYVVNAGDNLGEFRNGVCGVTATVFYAGSNDLIMYTNSPSAGDRKCAGNPAGSYPRKINVVLNSITYPATGVNVLNIGSVALGNPANRQVGIPLASGGPCDRVQFNLAEGGVPVTRTSTSSYAIVGTALARCVASDGSYTSLGSLSVNFTANSY